MPVLDPNEIMFTAFEPTVSNRFIMYIDGIPSYMIKKADAPGVTLNEIKLDHINVYRKIKGKAEWRDMTLSLYNPISPTVEWCASGATAPRRTYRPPTTTRTSYRPASPMPPTTRSSWPHWPN